MQLVLEQEPVAAKFLDGGIVVAMEGRRGDDQQTDPSQAQPFDRPEERWDRAAPHEDGRNIEHFIRDRRAREGDQPGEKGEKQLIDVAGVEDRRALQRIATGEQGGNGAQQRANPMPVSRIAREAQRNVRPGRLIGGVVALAPKAEDRDAIAEVHELLNALQRAGIGHVGAEEQEFSAICARRGRAAERPVMDRVQKAGIVSCVD